MNRLPTLLLRCLLWACLFVGSRSAEGSFPKSSPPCPVTVNLPDPVAFTHDARGNLLNDGQPLLAYDAEDQLTSIRVPPTATASGWETQFVYDGLGRLRIRREITVPATGSTTTRTTNQVRYLYDGFTAVQERDGNNAVLATYTRGNDLSGSPQGAGGIGGLLARTDASGSVFYHADGGGNVTTLFNAAQAVVGRYAYDPFGNLLGMSGAGAAGNRYRFSSKEVHPQTGMYYYGFRFYEPNLQRWTSRDPIEEMGGINLYGFVGNNPVDGVDPFGWSDFNRPPMVIIGPNGPAVYGPPMPDPMIGGSSGSGNPIGDGLSYYGGKLGDGYNGANNWVKNSGNPIIGKAWNMMHIPMVASRPFVQAAGAMRSAVPCRAIAAKNEVTVYRVFGGDSRAQGFSWTTKDPRTVANFRDGAGLPSGGASGANNTADFLIQGKVNPADIIKSRPALPLDGNKGGLPELIIDPKNVKLIDFSVLKP